MKLIPHELKSQIKLGLEFAKNKDYRRAELAFLKILKDHSLADVYNHLGAVYADWGKFNLAESFFKRALKINPNYMEAALNLSVVYNNLGLGKKSKEIYQKLTKYGRAGKGAMDPMLMSKLANLHGEIADLYHSVGEYAAAIDEYQKAVELCPDFIDLQTKLATAYREAGNRSQAMRVFKNYKRLAKKYAPYWIAYGVSLYASNKSADAKKAWEMALKIDPKNSLAKAYQALVSKSSQRKKASKKKAKKKAKKKTPTPRKKKK